METTSSGIVRTKNGKLKIGKIAWVVTDETNLGYYTTSDKTMFKTVASKIGGRSWMDGAIPTVCFNKIRHATKTDFDKFLVSDYGVIFNN